MLKEVIMPNGLIRLNSSPGGLLTIHKWACDELALEVGDMITLIFGSENGAYKVVTRLHKSGNTREIYLKIEDMNEIVGSGSRKVENVIIRVLK